MIQSAAAVVQLIGLIFNAKKMIVCWPIWCGGNILWMIYAVTERQWTILVVNLVFVAFNIYGWRTWLKERKQCPKPSPSPR